MDTDAHIPTNTWPQRMHIDGRFLILTQWLSPSFPIGAFAWSHGIENAVRDGWIDDAESLEEWLCTCLTEGSGRADAIWLRLAFEGDADAIDRQARAFMPSRERLAEAAHQGTAFRRTTNAVWGLELPELILPVAVGRAASEVGLDPDMTVQLYLQSFLSNLVAAAQRLMPLGQTEGQRVLAALQPTVTQVTEEIRDATVDDIFSNAFLADIASMRHETLEPRLFQS